MVWPVSIGGCPGGSACPPLLLLTEASFDALPDAAKRLLNCSGSCIIAVGIFGGHKFLSLSMVPSPSLTARAGIASTGQRAGFPLQVRTASAHIVTRWP